MKFLSILCAEFFEFNSVSKIQSYQDKHSGSGNGSDYQCQKFRTKGIFSYDPANEGVCVKKVEIYLFLRNDLDL